MGHRLVFGFGFLTWEWNSLLRGYLHPIMLTPVYIIMKFFEKTSPTVLVCFCMTPHPSAVWTWNTTGFLPCFCRDDCFQGNWVSI